MNAPATPVTTKRGRLRAPLIALLCLITVLGSYPDLAEARAGGGGSRGGSSMGSRGSRTYQSTPSNSPYQAKPIERSATPASNPAAATPGAAPQPVAPQRPSFFGSNPFLSSLAGGFIGAGLFGMLFGGGGIGGMGSPMGGALGGFLQIALLVGLGLMAYRWFKRSGARGGLTTADGYGYSYGATAPAPANSFGSSNFAPVSGGAGLATNNDSPLTLNDSDLQAFEALLGKIQHSWSQADMGQMRAQMTPEMLQYFNEILSGNTSRGEANHVEQVTLLAGNPIESWTEGEFDYATVHMKWRALDYTTRLDRKQGDADYVVSGSTTVPSEAEEIWTFVRTNGGNWILSAIQQVA